MSEIRLDPTTEEWVIITGEREKRPSDFVHNRPKRELPEFPPSCPFCPGNESMTTPETLLLHVAYKNHAAAYKIGLF